jgi:hypothetical protein
MLIVNRATAAELERLGALAQGLDYLVSEPIRQEESDYAAALPRRMAKIAGELNEQFSGYLPDGMRFTWEPADNALAQRR